MFKIGEDITIEVLENYGFKKDDNLSDDMSGELIYSVQNRYQKLCIDMNSKVAYLYEPYCSNAFFFKNKVLIDLIKDGIIHYFE